MHACSQCREQEAIPTDKDISFLCLPSILLQRHPLAKVPDVQPLVRELASSEQSVHLALAFPHAVL